MDDWEPMAKEAAKVASMDETPEAKAARLKNEYKNDALAIAETCLESFPGRRNAPQAYYWRKVCANIIQSQMTKH